MTSDATAADGTLMDGILHASVVGPKKHKLLPQKTHLGSQNVPKFGSQSIEAEIQHTQGVMNVLHHVHL